MSTSYSNQFTPAPLTACAHAHVTLHTTGLRSFGFEDVSDTLNEALICLDCGNEVAPAPTDEPADEGFLPV